MKISSIQQTNSSINFGTHMFIQDMSGLEPKFTKKLNYSNPSSSPTARAGGALILYFAYMVGLMSILAFAAISSVVGTRDDIQTEKTTKISSNDYKKLRQLCEEGYTSSVKSFIESHPNIDWTEQSDFCKSSMLLAIENNNEDIVNLIASQKNYNPTVTCDMWGWTDLHHLCEAGYTDAVKSVLKNNPNIDLTQMTVTNKSYIDIAREHGHEDLVSVLQNFSPNTKP